MSLENQNISVDQLCHVIDLLNPTIDDYIYLCDFQHDFFYISPHATERFSMTKNCFYGFDEGFEEFVWSEDLPALRQEIQDIIVNKERTNHNMEYRWRDQQGQPVWINCRGVIVRDDSNPLYMIGCINEIGEKQKADNISGLLGESSLKDYIDRLSSYKSHVYLLRLGIDDFGAINEKYGVEYGNTIIKKTAECIARCLYANQKLYRMIGDEFIVVDPSSKNIEDIIGLYKGIRQTIDYFVEENHYKAIYTISGGIFCVENINDYIYSDIMKYTEFALNEAKMKGKNTYYIFNDNDYQRFLKRRKLTQALRKSINQNFDRFGVYLQPLFYPDSNELFGAEALMRFDTDEFGAIAPKEFIPILEETGLIIPAGRWIIHQSLLMCKEIQKSIPHFKISINISHIQVTKSDLLSELLLAIDEYQVDPSTVIVELTESGILELDKNINKVWTQLSEKGVKLALDDFGTGYSNFHYLNDLKPDIIKIDRSFTSKAVQSEYDYKLLSLLSHMVHHLNLKICIEGIEIEEEREIIKNLAPDYFQGFYFGRPSAYQEFVDMFVKREN